MNVVIGKLVALALAVTLVVSCNSSTDHDNGPGDGNNHPSVENASFIGEWNSACTLILEAEGSNRYATFNYLYEATNWRFILSAYLDEECTSQMEGSEEEVLSHSFTNTYSGTYTDEGTVTTADGLQANTLELTVLAFETTAPENEDGESIGNISNTLVFVNDADVLFVDGASLGLSSNPDSLQLSVPFIRAE